MLNTILPCILIIIGVILTYKRYKKKNLPPQPFALPIIGNLLTLNPDKLFPTLLDLPKKNGPIIWLSLGNKNAVLVSDAKIHQEIYGEKGRIFLGRNDSTTASNVYNSTGKGLIFQDDVRIYRKLRNFSHSKLFSLSALRPLLHKIKIVLEKDLIPIFDEAASTGKSVNVHELFINISLNLFGTIAYGTRICGEQKETEAKKLKETIIQFFEGGGNIRPIDFLPIPKFLLKYDPLNKELLTNIIIIEDWIKYILDQHQEGFDPQNPRDFVDYVLAEIKDQDSSWKEAKPLLLKTLFDFLLAGGETVSVTCTWAIAAFSKEPEVIKKIQKELDEKFGPPKKK